MAWSQVPDRAYVYKRDDNMFFVFNEYDDVKNMLNLYVQKTDVVLDVDMVTTEQMKELIKVEGLKLYKTLENQWFLPEKEGVKNE